MAYQTVVGTHLHQEHPFVGWGFSERKLYRYAKTPGFYSGDLHIGPSSNLPSPLTIEDR